VVTDPTVRYATPQAMRDAVMARAKSAAGARPQLSVDQLLRQFAYARLLARLFVLAPEDWLLKGATGLVVRLPNARHSLDVDLWGDRDDVAEAEDEIDQAAVLDLGDHVSFDVGDWRRYLEGNRPLVRTNVACRIGRRPLVPPFGLDVVIGPPPPLPPDTAPPFEPFRIPDLPQPPLLRLYPIACSVAEKLAATLTLHYGFPSSRFRDLVDIATVALTQRIAARDLHIAISHELRQQDLPTPAGFAVPTPEAWSAGYTKQAQGLPHLEGIGFEQAVALVKEFLDPVLGGRRDGWWQPERRAWEP
jgi:Nucleotidyl transferase AbiEii toxin, Type IV TA system